MKCPKCNSTHSRVVDSRHADEVNAIRRRRECEVCNTRAEISSRDIGEYVMNLLMHVDQVSYVRFASVYKEFKDVDQLLQSMQGILSENKRSDS